MGNFIFVTTQRYDVPSGLIVNWYVGILLVDLDKIHNCHWNADRVIYFQTFIFQHISQVSGLRNICDPIDSFLDLWNKGAYKELVQDSYRV